MTNYRRGVETERKIMAILEEAGYVAVRTAGSHGPVDVIGIGPNSIRCIQAKRTKKGTFSYEQELDQLRQLPRNPHVSYELWVWRDNKGFVMREVV